MRGYAALLAFHASGHLHHLERRLIRAAMSAQRNRELEPSSPGRASRRQVREAISRLEGEVNSLGDLATAFNLTLEAPGLPGSIKLPIDDDEGSSELSDDEDPELVDVLGVAAGNAIAAFGPEGMDGKLSEKVVDNLTHRLQKKRRENFETKGLAYDPDNAVYRGPLGLPCDPRDSKNRFCLPEKKDRVGDEAGRKFGRRTGRQPSLEIADAYSV